MWNGWCRMSSIIVCSLLCAHELLTTHREKCSNICSSVQTSHKNWKRTPPPLQSYSRHCWTSSLPPGSQTPKFPQQRLGEASSLTNSNSKIWGASVGWLPSWVLVGVCGNSPSKCQAYSWETSVSCLKIHHETLGEQIHPLSQLRDIILGRPHTRLQARTSMLNLSCWLFGREATIGSLKQS